MGPTSSCGGRAIVELASPEAIYRMSEIPFSFAQLSPFLDSIYLPAGYFVVAGHLNINVGLAPKGLWLGAGQYVFTEEGALVGVQNIAYDARGNVPNSCGEAVHFQSQDLDRVGDDEFVRTPRGTGAEGLVFQLPPLHYRVTQGGVDLLGMPAITTTGQNGCQLERNERTSAVLDDLLVATEEHPGGAEKGSRNVVLALPDFAEIAGSSVLDCGGQTAAAITPLFGVGDRIVAQTHEYTAINPLDGEPFPQGCVDAGGIDLYELSGNKLVRVQSLEDPKDYIRVQAGQVSLLPRHIQGYAIDALDPSRVAIAFQTWTSGVINTYSLVDGEFTLEQSAEATTTIRELSLAGPYLARLDLVDKNNVLVEEDGVPLTVPPLPPDESGLEGVYTVSLSGSGTMLVGQRSQLALYRISCP